MLARATGRFCAYAGGSQACVLRACVTKFFAAGDAAFAEKGDLIMMTNAGLFDMDGSLADYVGQLLRDLELLRSPEEPALTDVWTAENRHPYIKARMRLIKAQPGWWLNLPPIQNGLRVFYEAEKIGYKNHILTKGPKAKVHSPAWTEKHQWCSQHLGDVPVTVTSDKSLFYGKFLYDDFPDYAESWLKHRPRGLVIMPANSWNTSFSHPRCVKWDGNNWDEVVRAMKIAFERKHGEPLKL